MKDFWGIGEGERIISLQTAMMAGMNTAIDLLQNEMMITTLSKDPAPDVTFDDLAKAYEKIDGKIKRLELWICQKHWDRLTKRLDTSEQSNLWGENSLFGIVVVIKPYLKKPRLVTLEPFVRRIR